MQGKHSCKDPPRISQPDSPFCFYYCRQWSRSPPTTHIQTQHPSTTRTLERSPLYKIHATTFHFNNHGNFSLSSIDQCKSEMEELQCFPNMLALEKKIEQTTKFQVNILPRCITSATLSGSCHITKCLDMMLWYNIGSIYSSPEGTTAEQWKTCTCNVHICACHHGRLNPLTSTIPPHHLLQVGLAITFIFTMWIWSRVAWGGERRSHSWQSCWYVCQVLGPENVRFSLFAAAVTFARHLPSETTYT
jgi:hypothetical protein